MRGLSWIPCSIEPSIALNLRLNKSVAKTWQYLKHMYTQENDAHQFQFKYEIVEYYQGKKEHTRLYQSRG